MTKNHWSNENSYRRTICWKCYREFKNTLFSQIGLIKLIYGYFLVINHVKVYSIFLFRRCIDIFIYFFYVSMAFIISYASFVKLNDFIYSLWLDGREET